MSWFGKREEKFEYHLIFYFHGGHTYKVRYKDNPEDIRRLNKMVQLYYEKGFSNMTYGNVDNPDDGYVVNIKNVDYVEAKKVKI